MAFDEITIWNLALGAIGHRSQVSSLTEKSVEANNCRLWYPLVRDAVQKAASWPSTKKTARLGLLAERDFNEDWQSTDPTPGFKYVYALPHDLIAPRFLSTYARFTIETYNGNRALMTGQASAVLFYSYRSEDPSKWDIGLVEATVYALGAALAMPITGKRTVRADMIETAREIVYNAQAQVANEADDPQEPLPEWITVRGYDEYPHTTRYYFPHEDLAGFLQ